MIDCQAFTSLTTKDIDGSITAAVIVSGILNYLNGQSVYPLSISLTHHECHHFAIFAYYPRVTIHFPSLFLYSFDN